MKNGWNRIALLLVTVMTLSMNIGCSSDSGSSGNPDNGDIPEEWIQACRDLMEAFCVKYVECDPTMAQWIFGVTEAGQCEAAVANECTDDGEDDPYGYDDDCEPETLPTEAQHQACLNQVQGATCTEFENIEDEGACGEYFAILECEDVEGDEDDFDAGGDDVTTTPDVTFVDLQSDGSVSQEDPVDEVTIDVVTDAPPVEINTAGCEAAVAASCTALATCAGQITIPPGAIQNLVDTVVGNCAERVTNGADNIAQACEDYLTEGVTTGQPNAIWLNGATPTEVQECVEAQDCDLSFVADLAGGVSDFFDDPSSTNLGALLAPLLSGCGG